MATLAIVLFAHPEALVILEGFLLVPVWQLDDGWSLLLGFSFFGVDTYLEELMEAAVHHSTMDTNEVASVGLGRLDGLKNELDAMRTAIAEILDHTRSLTDHTRSLTDVVRSQSMELSRVKDEMRSQTIQMASIRDELRCLRDACDATRASSNLQEKRQMYHEMLLLNQTWTFGDGGAQAVNEYLGSIQHDQELAMWTKEFLHATEEEAAAMRNGGNRIGYVSIRSRQLSTVNYLPYDRALYHHWRKFACSTLNEYRHHLDLLKVLEDEDTDVKGKFSQHRRLALCHVELPQEVLNLLSMGLHSTHFKCIDMVNNNIVLQCDDEDDYDGEDDSFHTVLEIVEGNHLLESFTFHDNPAISYLNADVFCRIIRDHPSLTKLDIIGGSLARGANIGHVLLGQIINAGRQKLKSLHCDGNRIGGTNERPPWDHSLFPDVLATNPVLTELWLAENQLDDNDAILLSRALKHNTNLRMLSLGNNPITETGKAALQKALFDDTSLNSASASNHICCIRINDSSGGNSGRGYLPCLINEGEKPGQNRAKKIYSILSRRNSMNSNVQYFDEIPVEFL